MSETKMLESKSFTKEMAYSIFEDWKKNKVYEFDEKTTKKVYSIDTPPPYVNTPVHIGHATTYTIMDFIARYKRMKNFEVIFPLGLDRNGLPIEMGAEKKFKVDFTKITREKAIEYCLKLLEEASLESVDSFFKCGISFNSWEKSEKIGAVYETDSPEYRAVTQATFIDLWNKGLVYEASKVVNWDPKLQSTIADSEITYEDTPGFYHNIVFKVKGTNEEIIIGTTRPELVCTCGMVIFNPEDKRYKHLEGKTLITPVFNKEVPCKSHPSAQIEKGTGIMMMCSYGDLTDIRFFIEQKIEAKVAIAKDGTMNENAGILQGLKIAEARKKIIEELEKQKLIKEIKPAESHRTPISERSGHAIEFIEMPELYLKQIDYKEKMKELAQKLNFYSPKSRQILLDWINSVSIDWPLTRRRYYATEVPLWYCTKCKESVLAKKGTYVQPWKEKYEGTCKKCGSKEFVGETRVFDTWFDSSISPLYILGYERNPEFFKQHDVCSLRPQGKEIVRTWLYYTVLKCYLLTGKLIFDDAWINYHIVDEKGYKMSKSKGNGIDPHDVLEKFGPEPFRLWSALEGNLDNIDFRCSYQRIQGAEKPLVKMWNVSKFIKMFPITPEQEKKAKYNELDKWILREINELTKFTEECYDKYDFHNPAVKITNFMKDEFASHYLELVKRRAYNNSPEKTYSPEEQYGAIKAIRETFKRILLLLNPINPAITSAIYKEIFNEELTTQKWPSEIKNSGLTNSGLTIEFENNSKVLSKDIIDFNSIIWKEKKDKGVSLKDVVKKAVAPESLKDCKDELMSAHGIKELTFGKEISAEVEKTATPTQ
jgi:valyl-tRNA synthetase